MVTSDFHMHTVFCDGKNTAEEMVLSAINHGLTAIGFSAHAFIDGEPDWTMPLERYPVYWQEIMRLKAKYASQIAIYCGVEQDILSPEPPVKMDYRIGSVHSVQCGEARFSVDDTPEIFYAGVQRCFNGDMLAAAECYYDTVSRVAEVTHADIIGHFDLITKFNEKEHFFNQQDPFYLACARRAADRLLEAGIPFEINTGAMSRGWRTFPYPDLPLMKYIASQGGCFVLSSDSHNTGTLAWEFARMEETAKKESLPIIDFHPESA